MPLFIRLLLALGKFFQGFGNSLSGAAVLACVLGYGACSTKPDVQADGSQKNQQVAKEQDPPLQFSEETETLFNDFLNQMELQYQISVLSRSLLTLPALPEEGY